MQNLTLNSYRKIVLYGILLVILPANIILDQVGTENNVLTEIPKKSVNPALTSLYNARTPTEDSRITFVDKWGQLGSGDGEFNTPTGIAVNSTGYVYVVEMGIARVQVFTPNGIFIQKWGSSGSGDGQFQQPYGIAVNSSGYVYVMDTWNNRVQVFTPSGTFVHKWGSYGDGDGQFKVCYDLAINGSDYIYVGDFENNRVQVFSPDGTFVQKWSSGRGHGIAVDAKGYVYLSDYQGSRVRVYTCTGTSVRSWGTSGSDPGEFNGNWGIAVDGTEYVYIAEYGNDRIQCFSDTGTYVLDWGSVGSNDGQFTDPYGIAINASNYAYIVDSSNHRIQIFSISFPYLHLGIQHLVANNQTINVTFRVEDDVCNALPDVFLEISNSTLEWEGNTASNGQYNLTLSYIPNQFTLEVNASKAGYLPNNETFMIYIDPPAVDYTPPIDELDPSTLATFGLFALIFVGPWAALGIGQWKRRKDK